MNKLILALLLLFFAVTGLAQAPVITSFSPTSGNIGSTITINGSGFDATPANNNVYIGVSKAIVTAASSTSLSVTVPGGAGYETISVNVNGLTAYSSLKFASTFSGTGSYEPNSFELGSLPFPVVAYSGAWATADLDGDGMPDFGAYEDINWPPVGILVDTISIYRNTSSNGSFSVGPEIRLKILGPPDETASVFFKDADGDGKPDVFVFCSNEHLKIYRNTSVPGTLSFDPPVTINWGQPQDVLWGDFDGDGKTDIGLLNNTYFGIFLNTSTPGNISFNPAEAYSNPNTTKATTADIDQDGKIDLILATGTTLHIMRNTGSTGSVSFSYIDLPLLSEPNRLYIGDLDTDQKEDVVLIMNNGFSIFRNISTPGTLGFIARDDRSFNNNGYVFGFNDMDGDGKPDIVGKVNFDSMGIFRNTSTTGNIGFDNYKAFAAVPPASFGTSLYGFADLNADGRSEILITQGYDFINTVSYLNNRLGDPRISSFDPKHAVGDTTINITGSNFSDVTDVKIGGIPAISFSIISSTQISAVVPAGASGRVILVSPYGADSLGFFNAPFISSFSPYLAGPGSPDTVVTITGYNFTGVTAVSFGGYAAASFTVVSDSQIKAVPGSYPIPLYSYITIIVTSAYGTSSKDNFVYASGISVELCPPAASTVLNTDVTVSGATYHWQVQVGTGNFNEVTDGANYSGSHTTSLHLINVPSSQYGYRYRCALSYMGPQYPTVSTVFVLRFVNRWNGSASTAWEDPANWSCGAIPDSNTDVVINSGATITLNSNTTIRSLYIPPGATLTISPGYNLTILH